MSNLIKIAQLADIHLGVLNSEYQLQNLDDVFITYCVDNKPDLIVIPGDIMEERVNLSSNSARAFHKFIDRLIDLDATVLIIEGTKSHDDNQIDTFSHKVSDTFKIYSKVTTDTVLGLRLLLIPEEYMVDPKVYYKEYLEVKHKYDFVYGHGMFDHIGFVDKKKPRFRKLTSPMWNYDKDFKNIVHGLVVFGHDHHYNVLDKFRYIGSFGRYRHGEEYPKGFIEVVYDKDSKTVVSEKFIENTGAKLFTTIKESSLSDDNDLLVGELQAKLDAVYRLRIDIDRKCDDRRRSTIVGFVNSNLKTIIKNSYADKHKKMTNKEQDDSTPLGTVLTVNKYAGMTLEEATIDWVLENEGIAMTKCRINKVINGA